MPEFLIGVPAAEHLYQLLFVLVAGFLCLLATRMMTRRTSPKKALKLRRPNPVRPEIHSRSANRESKSSEANTILNSKNLIIRSPQGW